ncbi:FAD-binding protein [uncultured Mailhella sp.]|uniref:FAD-binding protein n=1 Tax=uncultured Mailhella sp. TaxID=1981031 RepID=UPI002634BA5D|nr:FAD-binding protein [uncultured Mailhella sp.]
MSEEENTIHYHETEVLVLGGGASGCGAAIAVSEAGKHVLLVDKGKLESCGCIGGGNDHFMGVLNTDAPFDTIDDMVRFYSTPTNGLLPDTVRQWGEAMPHIIAWLTEVGIQFRKTDDGGYLRTQGFGQPGKWWILIRDGQFMKPLIAKKIREMGVDVLDNVMITKLLVKEGRMTGALGYNVLNGEFHVIRCKTAVLSLGPRATRVATNSTRNPFNAQFPSHNTGAHYILAYEAGARIACLDTRQTATVLPKSFGCPGMNGLTGEGGAALNYKGERFMGKYHPMREQAPRHLFVQGLFKEQLAGYGPPFYMDTRSLCHESQRVLSEELMPGDKATWKEYSEQKGVDLYNKLMEVEIGDLALEGLVMRDEHFESSIPGLFVGTGFHAFSGAMCGGYAAGGHAAEKAGHIAGIPDVNEEEIEQERRRVLAPLHSEGSTRYSQFESAIRQVMDYYMGYVRNERGMKQALDSLARIEELKDDLTVDNWHELMRAHEALTLLEMCKLVVLASIEHRETSSSTIYIRSDYPEPDPAMNRLMIVEKTNGQPRIFWQ